MYTVIVPTMWRGNALGLMLPKVNAHPLVEKIILINNDEPNTPQSFRNAKWKNLEEINLGKNIFVNPAWNLGVEKATTDKICIMSDDVFFDDRVFSFLYNKLPVSDGCIGPDAHCFHGFVAHFNMDLQYTRKQSYGYGTLMFLNKSNFIKIPEDFKIFYGDNWIFNSHLRAGKIPRTITNFFIKTKMETTSGSKEFSKQVQMEHDLWKLRSKIP